jgi:hypothetical protein
MEQQYLLFPEFQEVRCKSRIMTPSGRNTAPYISLGRDPHERFNKKETNYKGAFATLSKRGGLQE